MHHFQLKPVRSLDSLRPAWSGHIRHGPPPSTIVTNQTVTPSTKTTSCTPHSTTLISPVDQSNILLNTNDMSNSQINANNSTFPFDAMGSKPNKTREETDKSLLLPALQRCNDNVQTSNISYKIHTTEFMKYNTSLYSRKADMEQCKNDFENSTKNSTFYTDNIFPNHDSDLYPKENDPFDTSKVFMPSYLHPPIFQATNASLSVNCHVPSHAYNSTSCSAYSKVNIIIHYLFCESVVTFSQSLYRHFNIYCAFIVSCMKKSFVLLKRFSFFLL